MVRAGYTVGAKMKRMAKALDDPAAVLKQIGALIVSESLRAFKEQKHGKTPWKPRAVPNVYGIIADFYGTATTPPKRRFEATPALRDTGRLSKSIAAKIIGKNTVEIGSNLPYADTMHGGGPIESKPINEQVVEKLSKFLGTKKKPGKGYQWRKQLGFLLNQKYAGKTLKGNVEARPIVGITKQTVADIEEAVHVTIFEIK